MGVNAAVVGLVGAALYDPVWTTAITSREDLALGAARLRPPRLLEMAPLARRPALGSSRRRTVADIIAQTWRYQFVTTAPAILHVHPHKKNARRHSREGTSPRTSIRGGNPLGSSCENMGDITPSWHYTRDPTGPDTLTEPTLVLREHGSELGMFMCETGIPLRRVGAVFLGLCWPGRLGPRVQ